MSSLDTLGVVANVFGVADLSSKLLSTFAFYVRDVKNAQDERARLMQEVLQFHLLCDKIKALLDSPQGAALKSSQALALAIADCERLLQELDGKLNPTAGSSSSSRRGATIATAVLWPFQRRDVDDKIKQLESYRAKAESALQIDQTTVILNLDAKLVLGRLPIADSAVFNSQADEHNTTCLAGTSVEILDIIARWVSDPNAKSIFWLSGRAGTGKSTVSRSVAHSLSAKDQLCGSFFFKRNEGTRSNLSKFFSTLAADLVLRDPALAQHVKEALDEDPHICTKTTTDQFEKLFYEPLAKASSSRLALGVLVIDALDECDSDDNIVLLLDLLSRVQKISNGPKIFITSRPELYIRMAFRRINEQFQHATMEETAGSQADIALFIQHELTRIRINYNYTVEDERRLPEGWPDAQDVDQLSKAASPLFIFAATVCRLVADRSDGPPDERLKYVLEYQNRTRQSFPHHIEQLASTYMPTLSKLLVNQAPSQQHETLQGFKHLVGAIVTVAIPLEKSTLAGLLGMKKSVVDTRLDLLHSVLDIPSQANLPVRVLHLSFSDFLVNCKGNNPFWIDEHEINKLLLDCCLHQMGDLKQDICDLKDVATSLSEIDSETIDRCLPLPMRHLLNWIEAVSLLGMCAEALVIVTNLRSLFPKTRPLQVYSSFLVFAPKSSKIRNQFLEVINQTFRFLPNTGDNWSGLVQSMKIPRRQIAFTVFSPDLSFATVPDKDTVSIRQLRTGLNLHTLDIKTYSYCKIAISPDCKLVATESRDGLLQIFSLDLAAYLSLASNNRKGLYSVVFSSDSELIASAAVGGCLDIWSLKTSRCIASFVDAVVDSDFKSGKNKRIGEQGTLLFSPDSSFIALASPYTGLKVWHIEAGECTHLFQSQSSITPLLVFSRDSSLLAAVFQTSSDASLRVWNVVSHDCICVIDIYQRVRSFDQCRSTLGRGEWIQFLFFVSDREVILDLPISEIWKWHVDCADGARILKIDSLFTEHLAFSPDLRYVAESELSDFIVRHIDSGDPIHSFSGSLARIYRAQFSSDSRQLVTLSTAAELSLWNLDGVLQSGSPSSAHDKNISGIVLSPDSKLAVSTSFEYQTIVWSCETGAALGSIDLDKTWGFVQRVFFSPDSSRLAILQAQLGKEDKISLFRMPPSGGMYRSATLLSRSGLHVSLSVFSHDSSRIAVFGSLCSAKVWDVHSGAELHRLKFDNEQTDCMIRRAALTNKLLALVRGDRLEVWRLELADRMCAFEVQDSETLHSVDISPDSSLVAAWCRHLFFVWQVATGMCIYTGSLEQLLRPSPVAPRISELLSSAGYIGSKGYVAPGSNLYTWLAAFGEQRFGYGITQEPDIWITWNKEKVLWVPPEARMRRFQVSRTVVAMLCQLGTVIIIRFKDAALPGRAVAELPD
ncbi:hypothetical protein PWT90_03255 [Aphanocladium album]|nr:hypothetical protein PWT90_03255 [Aphanocladium album]